MGEEVQRVGADTLVFAVNGEKFELSAADPSTTLLEFLRTQTRFKGTKLGCGEGGCGACVVLLSKYDPVIQQVENFTVSSCLTLLCSLNGCSITTTEGLGNSKDGLHPIHKRFEGFHASQCGYCTPGMCISLFSALINAETTQRLEPPMGFSKLTVCEAERSIAGNLCRCTGYRPIADACKSFAVDVDIEDLGINSFWNKGHTKETKLSKLPFYNANNQISTYPDFLKNKDMPAILNSQSHSWYSPVTLEELQGLMTLNLAGEGARVKLVVGNTGTGYYKELERYDQYVDLRYIPELSMIKQDQTGIEFGTVLTISKAIVALKEYSMGDLCSGSKNVFKKIADHMEKVASGFIRSSASVGGNLVMAQRKYFPSDIATILLAVGSTVTIMTGVKREKLTLEEFLSRPPLDSRSVLLCVKIPRWQSSSMEQNSKLLCETYRAAPRPLGNALPYLNCAFLADVSSTKAGTVVNHIKLVFGAYGTKHAIRAKKVEDYLAGKMLDVSVLYEAVKLVRAAVSPEDGTSHAAYRSSLAVGFLFKFLGPFIDDGTLIFDQSEDQSLLSSARQVLESSRDYCPVGEPIPKPGAALQASGEAVYVDDIPSPTDCLHGAFIYSKKPLAWVKGINFKPKELPDGVTAVISYKDIPVGGENVGSRTIFGFDPLFADELTRCAGDRLAFVVADTQRNADMAADMAVVEYDTKNLEPPILTVEEAVKQSSFFPVPPFLYPKQIGDISRGMAEADHKILSAEIKLGSQYYFYLETQTTLAVPDEDQCIVVYTSSQCPEFAHTVIAKCLGIPDHNVRVITRRVGGGFGGKAIRAMPIATACALAAYKLNRPVRIYLNRKTDMIMAGGRHPMKITYSVGFKSSGKITALHLDILINAGIDEDISPILPHNMLGVLKKYDWGALSFDIKLCKTNHFSKSAMRGPGEVQASFIAEAIIEHVASELSMEVDAIRNENFHSFESLNFFYEAQSGEPHEYTLSSIWDKVAISANFFERIEAIKQYNAINKWRKRAICRIPIVNEVSQRPTPGKVSILWDGSVIVEVGGIELGQGLWTKVKQMTAFALGSVSCDGTEGLLEKVRVIQADTLSLVQGAFTAGSTTSESSCQAVRLCCKVLVERLTPLKEKLREQMGTVTWETLIFQANQQAVDLSARSYYTPEMSSMSYLNYGAAVTEVEVDILTGGTRILRADIIYDCGQSLNPAVDLGQIEGAFVQGIGFFLFEEYLFNEDGLVVSDSTWTYKIPTIDTIPREFNVQVLNSGHHKNQVLSSKASGEPPYLLAASVHCAVRGAIKEARKELHSWSRSGGSADSTFYLDVPATMPVVKTMCGLNNVEAYFESLLSS